MEMTWPDLDDPHLISEASLTYAKHKKYFG